MLQCKHSKIKSHTKTAHARVNIYVPHIRTHSLMHTHTHTADTYTYTHIHTPARCTLHTHARLHTNTQGRNLKTIVTLAHILMPHVDSASVPDVFLPVVDINMSILVLLSRHTFTMVCCVLYFSICL